MAAFPDIVPDLKSRMPDLRGRLLANQTLDPFTWFRVGGPAQALFMPEDESDLAYFLKNLPADIPLTVIGAASNMIVRDGGVPGAVVRLGRGFNDVAIEDGHRVRAGSAILDVLVARAAQKAGVGGLSFLSGIPGTIGGALRMNGGAYGGETKDVLIEATGVDRQGNTPHLQQCRHGIFLSPLRRARGCHLHRRAVARPRRRSGKNRRRDGRHQSQARSEPAAQSHRRLDLQESARP